MAVLRFAGDRFSWLSGDTKPTDVLVGSFGIEIDTGDSYYYDGSTWSKTTDVGEVNTVSNVGSGQGVYKSKTGVNFEFKSLVAGNNITFDISNSNEIKINSTAGTVTSVGIGIGTSGTNISVSGSPITSSGTITLNIPTASANNRGALSSSDWSAFNSKAGGTGAANKVAFWTGTNTLSYNTNLHWDNTNGRLGIGTASPGYKLDVNGDLRVITRTGTPTLLSGFDNNGKIMDVTVSTGLTLSGGVLTAQGTVRDLSYGSKSSGIVPLQITGGTSVNFIESPAIFLDRISSSNMAINLKTPYAQMYSTASQDISNVGGTAGGYKINFDTSIISNCNINKVTFNNSNDRLIINAGYSGIYKCTYNLDLYSLDNSNLHDIYIVVKKNGTEVTNTKTFKLVPIKLDIYHSVTRTFFLELNSTDYIELFIVKNSGSGQGMRIFNANVSVNYISDEICIPI